MAHSFNLRDFNVVRLRARLGLTRASAIGRGSFSAVFAHPDASRNTVIKLTSDPAGYCYLGEGARAYHLSDFDCFPKVVDSFDELNAELIAGESPLRVVELERLAIAGRAARPESRLLFVYAGRTFPHLLPMTVTDADKAFVMRMEKERPELCAELEEFGTKLSTFCADYNYRIDGLARGNAMRRGDQLVFNDPVYCPDTLKRI